MADAVERSSTERPIDDPEPARHRIVAAGVRTPARPGADPLKPYGR